MFTKALFITSRFSGMVMGGRLECCSCSCSWDIQLLVRLLNFQIQVLLYFSAWQTSKLFQKWSDFQNFSGFQNFSDFKNFSDFQIFLDFKNFLDFIYFRFSETCRFSELFSFQISFRGLKFCLISLSLQFYKGPGILWLRLVVCKTLFTFTCLLKNFKSNNLLSLLTKK